MPPVRTRIGVLAVAASLAAALAAPLTTLAADAVNITTDYPAVAVEPGKTASFDLKVAASPADSVALDVSGVPTGWTATLRGGGFVIDGVFAGPSNAPDVTLNVVVPDDAPDATTRIAVRARSGSAEDTLTLSLRVAREAGGSVSMTTNNPTLRDDAKATFPFTVELKNDTPQELTFTLSSQGPAGWDITATPSGQAQAASVVVGAGASSNISVSVNPPDDAAAGQYPIHVEAVSGEQTAAIDLGVEITGSFALSLSTPDERLTTNANAGATKDFTLVVRNDGTAPLANIAVSGSGPQSWKIEPDIPTIAELAPGTQQQVIAKITPSSEAIAGDYVITFRASATEGGSDEIQVRTTVDTALSWGLVGIALIILTLVGLGWVFQRYGRR